MKTSTNCSANIVDWSIKDFSANWKCKNFFGFSFERLEANADTPRVAKKKKKLQNFSTENLIFKKTLLAMDEDYTIYREENLFAESLSVLREIRRQGRLCDIILKVNSSDSEIFINKKHFSLLIRSIMKHSQLIGSFWRHRFRFSTQCSRKITPSTQRKRSS